MGYNLHNFKPKSVLHAKQLNEMDAQIKANSDVEKIDVNYDADNKALTFTPGDSELIGPSLNHVHLYCDGDGIMYFKDKDAEDVEYLTFTQIKELIEDDNNIIFITNGYYSFYGKYYYHKSLTHEDVDAIGFIGETQLGGSAYSWRIAINENDEIIESEIKLAKAGDYISLTEDQKLNEWERIIAQDNIGIITIPQSSYDSLETKKAEALYFIYEG